MTEIKQIYPIECRKCFDKNNTFYCCCCCFLFNFRITSPLILIVIGGLMYASYRVRQIQGPVSLFGKLFSVNQLCIALNVAGIPILYLFGAGNIMFWVVGKFFALSEDMLRFQIVNMNGCFDFDRCLNIGGCIACFILQHRCHCHRRIRIISHRNRNCVMRFNEY